MGHLRPAVLSGTWYPGEPSQLTRTVRGFLAEADRAVRPTGRPLLAVVPHAGYSYSGPAAGRLYGLLEGLNYDRVFILAPSHRATIDRIALSGATAFAVPGGKVTVDHETVAFLTSHPSYEIDDDVHASEHAVEIQLPFLREIFGANLRIVPLLVPHQSDLWLHEAAQVLEPWCDGSTLFVVSTDFTHYGMAYGYVPFADPSAEKLAQLDRGAIDLILARDASGLLAYGEKTGITMCGIQAAALALSAPLPAGGEAHLVDYRRSGDRDGNYSMSVSYASLLLTSPARTAEKGKDTVPTAGLDPAEKGFLLALARHAVTAAVAGQGAPESETWAATEGRELTSRLRENCGAFVTLTQAGRLRGCIGTIEGSMPLAAAVAENSVGAATRDTRFEPVQPEELDDLHIEISVLTPLRSVASRAEIVLGRHGIILQKGTARAVFLPQVAPEQGWDLETTLTHLALKAGLGPDGWREGASWQVFEAEIFGEE